MSLRYFQIMNYLVGRASVPAPAGSTGFLSSAG